jgi:hypothetical protein
MNENYLENLKIFQNDESINNLKDLMIKSIELLKNDNFDVLIKECYHESYFLMADDIVVSIKDSKDFFINSLLEDLNHFDDFFNSNSFIQTDNSKIPFILNSNKDGLLYVPILNNFWKLGF